MEPTRKQTQAEFPDQKLIFSDQIEGTRGRRGFKITRSVNARWSGQGKL